MKKLFAMLGVGGVTTLLARKIEINPNPSDGEDYLYVEGDQVGFWNWLLKLLGLKDPSVKVTINSQFITRVDGGKFYQVSPTSGIYGFNAGFTKNKKLLLMAALFFFIGLVTLILSLGEGDAGPGFIGLILFGAVGAICLWLYGRSGALIASVSCFKDPYGEDIRIKSGLTGKKLDKNDFENVFNALKNASTNSSSYYKK
jgi:hypothetical protein